MNVEAPRSIITASQWENPQWRGNFIRDLDSVCEVLFTVEPPFQSYREIKASLKPTDLEPAVCVRCGSSHGLCEEAFNDLLKDSTNSDRKRYWARQLLNYWEKRLAAYGKILESPVKMANGGIALGHEIVDIDLTKNSTQFSLTFGTAFPNKPRPWLTEKISVRSNVLPEQSPFESIITEEEDDSTTITYRIALGQEKDTIAFLEKTVIRHRAGNGISQEVYRFDDGSLDIREE